MIKVSNLVFNYPRQKRLFDDLSLQLDEGKIVGLLGKNGAGKTTLLKLLTGLVFPVSGDLEVLGFKPYKRNPYLLRDVAFVPEEFHLPSVSVSGFIKANSMFYPNFNLRKLKELLNDFELLENQRLDKMSYGQKKKFLISFALASQCKLLVMDEPTNGLDIPSKIKFRKVVAGALTDQQLLLISTHQVKDVENIIDQIVILEQGKIIFKEDTADISNKYSFVQLASLNNGSELYYETAPGGYKAIVAQEGIETNIDIELLFNAVINQKL